jgi:nicotinamide-nucleotide amidase
MSYSRMTELFPTLMIEQASEIIAICTRRHLTIATAESCTGGLVSAILTEISGASNVFTHGFITYANPAKVAMIDVPESALAAHGAVSEQVARAMAEGALHTAGTLLAVGITGIAGPYGGSPEKPVGLVHVACAAEHAKTLHRECHFEGSRTVIRLKAVEAALALLLNQLLVI